MDKPLKEGLTTMNDRLFGTLAVALFILAGIEFATDDITLGFCCLSAAFADVAFVLNHRRSNR